LAVVSLPSCSEAIGQRWLVRKVLRRFGRWSFAQFYLNTQQVKYLQHPEHGQLGLALFKSLVCQQIHVEHFSHVGLLQTLFDSGGSD
jgi:hypothetical protein